MFYKMCNILGMMSPQFIYVKGNDLTEKQLESLVDLFLTTSYYEFCAMENKLKLPVREFIRVQCVIPQLSMITVMVNNDNKKVVGFFCGAKRLVVNQIWSNITNYFRDERTLTDKAYADFINDISDETDFVLNNLAIDSSSQNQGFCTMIFNQMIIEAKSQGCTSILLTNWESHHKSMGIYKHYGFQEVGEFSYTKEVFHESLIALRGFIAKLTLGQNLIETNAK